MEELGTEEPWKVVRVAKDPFYLHSSMEDMIDGVRIQLRVSTSRD